MFNRNEQTFVSVIRVFAIVAILIFSGITILTLGADSASSANLTVTTQNENGSSITGYWVIVETTSGSTVATGFSPVYFTLPAGNYLVATGNYGSEYFNHWSDGTTNRYHSITIGSGLVDLTAIYSNQTISGSTISVNSQYENGSSLNGMYVSLSQNGKVIASGFTPKTFSTTSGQTYYLTADDYTNAYFNHWNTGSTNRTIQVTATSSGTSLTSIYTQTPQSPPPTGNSITVIGKTLNGSSAVNGIRVDLRINGTNVATGFTPITFTGLQQGVQYGVVVYWYGNYYIRYINDSNTGMDLQRYDLVTLNQSNPTDQLTAVFEYVPPSQAASLNILAEFPNGTRLGTATVVNGYDLHSPGMWLTITPPFQKTPYTGTFTGGSVLPFILFNHETYIVDMSPSFCGTWTGTSGYGTTVYITFSHWQDDGSTNATRTIPINGNLTLTAIYQQNSVTSCSSA